MTEQKPETAHSLFLERFRAGDIDGIMALYEDDAVFVTGPGETVRGKAAIREALQGFLAMGGEMSLTTRYAVQHGDLALLSNEWHISGTGADGKPVDARGQTTEVVRRQADGSWHYVIDHPLGGQ